MRYAGQRHRFLGFVSVTGRYRLAGYLSGATCARLGDEMSGPALLLLALSVSGSSAQASFVFSGLTISSAVGGPLFGVVLDRANRPGHVLAVALLAYGTGLGVVAVALGRVSLIVVVAGAVAVGMLAPALAGGWTSQLPAVVEPDRLAGAHAMDAATYNLATLAGPAMAAGLTSALDASWAVVGAVVVLLVAAPLAWGLPAGRHDGEPLHATSSASVGKQLQAGFRALVQISGLRAVTAASCVAYVGSGMFFVACPILGQSRLGGASRGALLLSVVAAAALLATSVLARWTPPWRPETTFLASTLLSGVAFAVIAVPAGPGLLVLGAAVLGVAAGPQLASTFALRQQHAPAGLRGQVFTTAASLKLTAGAIGSAAAGIVLEHSMAGALILAAAAQLAAVLIFVLAAN